MENTIQQILDPNFTGVFTLMDSEGNPVEFQKLAVIPYKNVVYVLTHPVTAEDELAAALFAIKETTDGINFELVQDEDLWIEVHTEFMRLASQQELK